MNKHNTVFIPEKIFGKGVTQPFIVALCFLNVTAMITGNTACIHM